MASAWEEFRPTKTLWIWSCIGSAALTMVIGFAAAGWVTAGTASEMVSNARDHGRAELAASVCIENFKNGDDFAAALTSLKAESSWSRDNFLVDGGWVALAGLEAPVPGAAELCAEALAKLDAPTAAAKADLKTSG